MKSPNPFSGGVDALSDADFALLVDAVETRRCRELVGAGTYDEAARKWRPRPRCPSCSHEGCASDGSTPAGHRAWSCGRCGRKFNSLTGTVFENAKRALWRWVVFIRLMCFNVQLDACAELCGISHQTAWEWRHRVMATVDGYQDRIVLGGKVWIDEMYVTDSDLKGDPGWRPKRASARTRSASPWRSTRARTLSPSGAGTASRPRSA